MNGDASSEEYHTDGWLADTVRIVFFPANAGNWPSGLLERLIKQPAEVEQTSKRGGLSTTLEAVKVGAYQVNAIAQPNRLDVHVSVAPQPDEQTIVYPASQFRELISTAALNGCELAPFNRLGTSASLIKPRDSKVAAYAIIKGRFPCLDLDPASSDDFVLQMNPFVQEQAVRINCIERWSYGVFERIDIPAFGTPPQAGKIAARLEGVKLDLDFNTSIQIFEAQAARQMMEHLIDAMYKKIKDEKC